MGEPILDKLRLETLRADITAALLELEPLFVPEMKLTFVARHPDNPDCHITLTNDPDLAAVAALWKDGAK